MHAVLLKAMGKQAAAVLEHATSSRPPSPPDFRSTPPSPLSRLPCSSFSPRFFSLSPVALYIIVLEVLAFQLDFGGGGGGGGVRLSILAPTFSSEQKPLKRTLMLRFCFCRTIYVSSVRCLGCDKKRGIERTSNRLNVVCGE